MKLGRFKDQEHLLRVVAIFGAGILLFVLLQALFVPKSFGLFGHYRAAALDESRERPLRYAGRATCAACHAEAVEAAAPGKHAKVACEACHGPQSEHASADDPAAHKPERPTAALCVVCHAANVAKPSGFPQVKLGDHAEPGTCLECHAAHQPGL